MGGLLQVVLWAEGYYVHASGMERQVCVFFPPPFTRVFLWEQLKAWPESPAPTGSAGGIGDFKG